MKGIMHHIEIYVSDLKESKDFWEWLFEAPDRMKVEVVAE